MTTLKRYHYPEQYETLLCNTREHEMHILHDDGLYRHLRFQRGGSAIWHWDLVTWPGSLAIRGDIGTGDIFTRERDMLTFFDHGQADGWINPSYWAEKAERTDRELQGFSENKFAAWVEGAVGSGPAVPTEPTVQDAARCAFSTEEAIELLDEHGIPWDYEDAESWMDYDYHFILGLHAILWGAKKYHAERGVAQ